MLRLYVYKLDYIYVCALLFIIRAPMKSILIVDDHQIVYSGIQLMFTVHKMDFELQNCKNGDRCIEMLRNRAFDLIILDVNLPDTDTFQLIGLIMNIYPAQKILIFSMSSEEMYAKRFLKLGALGFISKQESNDEFLYAIQTVLEGNRYLSSYMIKVITNDALHGNRGNVFEKLSPREFEIMSYFLSGHGSKEVANITNLHSSTIGTYKFKIFDKLGIKNILELQELAHVHGLK